MIETARARDEWGKPQQIDDRARELVARAQQGGKLPCEYDNSEWGTTRKTRGRRLGEWTVVEIVDYAAHQVLVQYRAVEGTRYGAKTVAKDYWLVQARGRGVTVMAIANKHLVGWTTGRGGPIGAVLEALKGRLEFCQPEIGYKVVRPEGKGYTSVYDGTEWKLRVNRDEQALPGHRGGLYYYATPEEAASAAQTGQIARVSSARGLVVLEVEASGHRQRYQGGKIAASRIKPLREVACLI